MKVIKNLPFNFREEAVLVNLNEDNEHEAIDIQYFGENGENILLSIFNTSLTPVLPDNTDIKVEEIRLDNNTNVKYVYTDGNLYLFWEDDVSYALNLNKLAYESLQFNENNLKGRLTALINMLE